MDKEVEMQLIQDLSYEWGDVNGFFFQYRDGKFSEEGFVRVSNLLKLIDYHDSDRIPKRLVSLIYSIPFFLDCNKLALKKENELLCDKAIRDLSYILFEKLEK